MTRDMVIDAAIDLFGYRMSDFRFQSLSAVLDYLTFDQLEKIKEFYGYSKLKVETV